MKHRQRVQKPRKRASKCDRFKVDRRGCNGALDMVIEILSPSTSKHDRVTTFRKYRAAAWGGDEA
ncbi:MAG: Uma2 family endonuclease [Treponema sp.]|nr:Uma2 family endonuclease [Treponema sp.]